jgi:hypothetical protein
MHYALYTTHHSTPPTTQGPFIAFIGIGFLLSMVSNSMAMVLGASVSDVKAVSELADLVFFPQILFGGFLVRMSQVGSVRVRVVGIVMLLMRCSVVRC